MTGHAPERTMALSESRPTARDVWSRFGRGVADRRSPLRHLVLATTDLQGHPAARTVVLRGAELGARTLVFHTDRRSDKAAHLAHQPMVSCLFWAPRARTPLRATGRWVVP